MAKEIKNTIVWAFLLENKFILTKIDYRCKLIEKGGDGDAYNA